MESASEIHRRSDIPIPELGVGLIYWSALEPLFEAGTDLVNVLEVEPQTLWEKVRHSDGWRYRANERLCERAATFPQAKLVHGIGHPLGGTVGDPVEHISLLREVIDQFDPAWVSEHLSFNRVHRNGSVAETGFLFPPRQSVAGASVAAHNIGSFRRALGRPTAFETGVSYLRPRVDELGDAAYFRAVAEKADCGILLDLHNLWCNEVNGRERVLDVVEGLPLDRVWEIHLAGGMQLSGYWLDAHSGAVPSPLMDIAAEVVSRLPNLGALMFEILPEHLSEIGIGGIESQLQQIQALWATRPARTVAARRDDAGYFHPRWPVPTPVSSKSIVETASWEEAVAAAVRGDAQVASGFDDVDHDPGIGVLRQLVVDFRRANLARALRYTMTALLAGLGARVTHDLIDAYCGEHDPDPYPAVEADTFARYLRTRPVLGDVPYLRETLEFEHALVRATLFGVSTDVEWSADPTAILAALESGRLPSDLPPMRSRMRVS